MHAYNICFLVTFTFITHLTKLGIGEQMKDSTARFEHISLNKLLLKVEQFLLFD